MEVALRGRLSDLLKGDVRVTVTIDGFFNWDIVRGLILDSERLVETASLRVVAWVCFDDVEIFETFILVPDETVVRDAEVLSMRAESMLVAWRCVVWVFLEGRWGSAVGREEALGRPGMPVGTEGTGR